MTDPGTYIGPFDSIQEARDAQEQMKKLPPILQDLAEMPDWNPSTGGHALHSVSEGRVYWNVKNKVCCIDHRAMNAVNPDRTIWRCLAFGCQTGAYVEWRGNERLRRL